MDQVIGIFPTPVMRVPGALGPEAIAALVAEAQGSVRETNAASDRLSHTAMVNPKARDATRKIAKTLAPKLVAYGALLFGEELDWAIKEMWVNVLETGGAQGLHNHANSFISGVVYLTPSHPSASTVFHRSLGVGTYVFNNENKRAKTGPYNAGKWVMPPVAPGDMVLFPSYVLHEVPRNQGPARMTMAFNALPDRLDSWGYKVKFE